MPLLKYLPHEICKPMQPNFLPHEICKPEPKPTLTIRIYPAAPHEFFIPKPTEKPTTPLKPLTTIRACLWAQNPQTNFFYFFIFLFFFSDSQLQSTRSETETEESWKPTIKAADPTNRMMPSHNLPLTCRHLLSHHAASRVPRFDLADLISTFECRWQSSPTSLCCLFAVNSSDISCFAPPLLLFLVFLCFQFL